MSWPSWYTANGSAVETGRQLFLHPNSLRYRLRRIEELTGRSLNNPHTVLELGVALRALSASAGSLCKPMFQVQSRTPEMG
ncbi:helix-turn-helix domain-containing protein [Nocardia uniformis]|uniref:Helix-turn-helix domain-containing protein n=1 Tax=Nocardia uniformis TaxID=53432 RepID=A0A849BTJ9_9NOCA|nr:helix-turn-helix domain-containing protein [Nocardia uniformis]